MISSQGKNGSKIIHVDIVVPPTVHEHMEEELELLAVSQELDQLADLAARGEVDAGFFDKAKAAVKKVKEATDKAKEAVKKYKDKVFKKPDYKEVPEDKTHHASSAPAPQHVVVDFSDKYYTHMENMVKALVKLIESMGKPQDTGGDGGEKSSENPPPEASDDTPPPENGDGTSTALASQTVYFMLQRSNN